MMQTHQVPFGGDGGMRVTRRSTSVRGKLR
jgi:hypothetical protein